MTISAHYFGGTRGPCACRHPSWRHDNKQVGWWRRTWTDSWIGAGPCQENGCTCTEWRRQ